MTLRDDLRAYRRKVAEAIAFGDPTEGRPGALRDARKVAELAHLERTDTLPDEPYREKCSLCHFNAREVRDLCGQCWRAHEATQHELDYQRAQEDADLRDD